MFFARIENFFLDIISCAQIDNTPRSMASIVHVTARNLHAVLMNEVVRFVLTMLKNDKHFLALFLHQIDEHGENEEDENHWVTSK